MRIAIDARVINISTGRYVDRLIHYLQEIDTTNHYVILLDDKGYATWKPTNPNFTKVRANHPIYSFQEQTSFLKQLNSLDVDLVHFTMPQHPVLYRKPFIVTVHDLILHNNTNARKENPLKDFYKNTVKPAVFTQVLRNALTRSKHIITPTDYVKQEIIRDFGTAEHRITFTHEAGDLPTAAPREYTPLKDVEFITYVGNAYPYKNLRRLIDAFAIVKRDHPNLKLALVGKKDFFYTELEAYTESAGITNIVFTGFIDDGQLAWMYQHTKLGVFPSLAEGFGLPGLEAMAAGVPVVSSNASCSPEVYSEAAIYFNPENVEDIARTITATLSNKKLLADLHKKGLKRAHEFSWKRMAEQTLAIYKNATR